MSHTYDPNVKPRLHRQLRRNGLATNHIHIHTHTHIRHREKNHTSNSKSNREKWAVNIHNGREMKREKRKIRYSRIHNPLHRLTPEIRQFSCRHWIFLFSSIWFNSIYSVREKVVVCIWEIKIPAFPHLKFDCWLISFAIHINVFIQIKEFCK